MKKKDFFGKLNISINLYIPHIYPKCNIGNLNLVKFQLTCNPLKGGCSNYKCKARIYLGQYSTFKFSPKIPIQILINIFKGIIKGRNATQIKNDLRDKFNNIKINILSIILKILIVKHQIKQ